MKKKLRIAIFEPSRLVPGGGQKVMPAIAQHLSEKNEVTVFTQTSTQGGLGYGKSKIKLIKPTNPYLGNIAFFFQKINKEDFDFIIFGCYPATFAAFRNNNLPSLHATNSPPRSFYDLRAYLFRESNLLGKIKIIVKNVLFKKLDYIAVRKATKVIGNSYNVEKRVNKFYKRDSTFFHHGINPEDYKRGKYGDYILAAGRLEINKRPREIVEAMKFVKNRDIKLIIVGNGNLSEEIKEMTKKYANVDFRGFVSKEELKKLYSNCLAVIYVPIEEDYGYVPVEAAASGKATIGADEGGLKETIIDGKTGFLIKDITPEKIAEKIDLLANNRKLAVKMGKEAQNFSREFHWNKGFKILERTMEEAIELFYENKK
jgi:glycosyltransferase involved in cell wall biosynthesis